jgi:hypothetical protein
MEMSKVLVNFIQDRSGSMQSVWSETLSGFKSFVEDLKANGKKDGVEYLFSLTTFDTQVETPIVAKPIESVATDALADYGPRGCTALYDAVGATIKNTEDTSHGAEKIICVIVTDGQENSSREWSKDKLHQSIEGKLNLGNWTFTYLGTQPETWDDAQAMGISAGSTRSYTPTMAHQAYAATSRAVRAMSASMSMGERSLMDNYLPNRVMASAGMGRKPASTGSPRWKQPTPPLAPTGKKDKNRRWK